MSNEKPKRDAGPVKGTPPAVDPLGVTRNNSGRVKFDDRGNAVWEWAVTTGAFAVDVSTARLKKLESPELSLADDTPTGPTSAKPNPNGVAGGYSPYDSGLLVGGKEAPRKKTDLKRLSEYYKLRRQAEANKTGGK